MATNPNPVTGLPLSGGTLSGPLNVFGALSVHGQVQNFNGGDLVSTPGFGFQAKEGANCKQGTAVLVAGTVTVANTSVTASSRIFVSTNTPGGTPGWLQVSAIAAGTSFTILSSNALDTSTVAYEIFEAG